MRMFGKLYNSLLKLLKSLHQVVTNWMNKWILVKSFLRYLRPAVQVSVNLMLERSFYLILKFLVE